MCGSRSTVRSTPGVIAAVVLVSIALAPGAVALDSRIDGPSITAQEIDPVNTTGEAAIQHGTDDARTPEPASARSGVPSASRTQSRSSDKAIASPADRTPYGIETIYNDTTIARTTGGQGVDVAVLDTGVDRDHPDLERRVELCRDYTVDPVRNGSCSDENGHGTHVAGTVLADGGSAEAGIYGVAPEADLYAFKVCKDKDRCGSTAVTAAIRDAVDDGSEIIVLSLGGRSNLRVQRAIEYAHDHDVLVVAAAGNEGPDLDTLSYPAADALVVAVGAVAKRTRQGQIVTDNYEVVDFSSRGTDDTAFRREDGYMEVAAPGVGVLSTWKNGTYSRRSGTSVATPYIAGLAAKLWPRIEDRHDDGMKHDDVRRLLRERAARFDVGRGEHARSGYDPAAGVGIPMVKPPEARVAYFPSPPLPGESVSFTGIGSTSPDSEIIRYEWDFDGDGLADSVGTAAAHSFDRAGVYPVTLRVVNADGGVDVATTDVRVNAPPEAGFDIKPRVPEAGEVIRFDASTAVDPDGTIVRYEWDFDGDGFIDAQGPTPQYVYQSPKDHAVTLRVTDAQGATDTLTRELLVNDRPVVSVDGPTEVRAGDPVVLTATVTDEIGRVSVRWEFDDGGTMIGETVTHRFDPGTHLVTVTVEDEFGADARRQVVITAAANPARTTAGPTAPATTPTAATTAALGERDEVDTTVPTPTAEDIPAGSGLLLGVLIVAFVVVAALVVLRRRIG